MTLTTPAPERYTRFSCPNPECAQFNRFGEGCIAHRAWTGKDKHIERLRCTVCGCEFSERVGTLMARSKLPEATVERLLKCQRWGVCDEGTADICAVDLKTVHRFQQVAVQRAVQHHQQSVQNVDVQGVQLDEAPAQTGRVGAYGFSDGQLVSPVGRLRTTDPGYGRHAHRAGRRSHPAAPALSHGRVESLYCGAAPGRGGRVSSAASGESGPQAEAPPRGAQDAVVRSGGQGAQHDWPGRGGPQARGVRWPAPFWQAVASAPAWRDDPDSLYGTLVWDATGTGGAPAAPYPVSVLVPHSPPGEGLAHG
jgi:hypothetical protein